MQAHDVQLVCNDIPMNIIGGIHEEVVDGYATFEFSVSHSFGLEIGRTMPAMIDWRCEGESISCASGHVRLCGMTGWGDEKVTYHYIFQGHEIDEAIRGAVRTTNGRN